MAQWLTLEEAAAYLKMGKSTIYTLARTGHLPAHRAGKVWRFDAAELDECLRSGGLEPDALKKPHGPFRDRVYPPEKPSANPEDTTSGA